MTIVHSAGPSIFFQHDFLSVLFNAFWGKIDGQTDTEQVYVRAMALLIEWILWFSLLPHR